MKMFKEEYFGRDKENRKAYRGAKSASKSCRCHGTCDWCKANRLYSIKKNIEKTESEMKMTRMGLMDE